MTRRPTGAINDCFSKGLMDFYMDGLGKKEAVESLLPFKRVAGLRGGAGETEQILESISQAPGKRLT